MTVSVDLFVGEVEPFNGSSRRIELPEPASEVVVYNASPMRDRIGIRQNGASLIVTIHEPGDEPELAF